MTIQQEFHGISPRKRHRFMMVAGSVVVLGGLLIVVIVYFVAQGISQAEDLAKKTAEGIQHTFNLTPRIAVNGLTVVQETASIRELALLRQTIFQEYTWTHSFLGSTKILMLRGEFIVKAGYNLKEPWAFNIQDSPLAVEVQLPRPVILSLEMTKYSVVKDENGWWNAVSAQDREQAVMALRASVQQKVGELRLLDKVEHEAIQSITELVRQKSNGAVNTVMYKSPLP